MCATHEGSSDVKKNKIDLLVKKYELFKMEKEETIKMMSNHFNLIMNELTCLGKIYTIEDQVRKILRSLPVSWVPKITTIEEAKDPSSLALHELMGSLTTYEDKLESYKEEEVPKEGSLALKVAKALKQVKGGPKKGEDKDEVVAMLKKSFRELDNNCNNGNNNNKGQNWKGKGKGKTFKDNSNVECYRCHKMGHYQKDCPKKNTNDEGSSPRKGKGKGIDEALHACAWGESDSDSESSMGTRRICFVAKESV